MLSFLIAPDIRLSQGGCYFELSSKIINHVNDQTSLKGAGAGSSDYPENAGTYSYRLFQLAAA